MAFKLSFADNGQQPEQIAAQKESSCAELVSSEDAKELITPAREDKITLREAHVERESVKSGSDTETLKRNSSSAVAKSQPANEAKPHKRKKDGNVNQAAFNSVDSCRFSVLDFASLSVKAFSDAIREYERGVGIHNKCVGLMASHQMLENPALEGNIAEAKMGEYRDRIIRKYFLDQFGYLQHYHSVDTMVDIHPMGCYRKPVRPYHVYHDLFDYMREYPSMIRDYRPVLVAACRAVLTYYKCELDDGVAAVHSLDIKDQKGGKLGDYPKAVAKFQATMNVCAKIVNGGDVDATALYDLANRMRLFCPGFAPKDWRSSVR